MVPRFWLISACEEIAAVRPADLDLPYLLMVRAREATVQVVQPFQALLRNRVRFLENQVINQMSRIEPLFLHGGKPVASNVFRANGFAKMMPETGGQTRRAAATMLHLEPQSAGD